MNIQKNIDDATFYINKLKSDLPKMKNANQRKYTIDMLNSFITLINTIEVLLANNKQVASVDRLLVARIYGQMYQSVVDMEKIDINLIARNIDNDLKYSKSTGVAKLANLLRGHEIDMLVENAELSQSSFKSVTPVAEYELMINNLIESFRKQIFWN